MASVLAICYLIAPLKEPIFEAMHTLSHYVNSIKLQNVHTHHSHHHTDHHHTHQHVEKAVSHQRKHSHAHSKVTATHSHEVISFFDTVMEASEHQQKEHQKSFLNYDIDKHIWSLAYTINAITHFNYHSANWGYIIPAYYCTLTRVSPPPKLVS